YSHLPVSRSSDGFTTTGLIGHLLSLALASSVWAADCDSLRLHSWVPTAHAREALRFVNGPVVFWDLSRVPEEYREGGGRTTSTSNRLGDCSGSGSGYLSNLVTRSLPTTPQRGQSLKAKLPLLGGALL
ncbi:unnamed protein product, partial [Staurois parvus]